MIVLLFYLRLEKIFINSYSPEKNVKVSGKSSYSKQIQSQVMMKKIEE
jgi:hypothetical protein